MCREQRPSGRDLQLLRRHGHRSSTAPRYRRSKVTQKEAPTPQCSRSGHSTWRRHGGRARAAGRGLASQGAEGARLRHGLHHHGARRSQVGLPRGGYDLKDAACNHMSTKRRHSRAACTSSYLLHARPHVRAQMKQQTRNPNSNLLQQGSAEFSYLKKMRVFH